MAGFMNPDIYIFDPSGTFQAQVAGTTLLECDVLTDQRNDIGAAPNLGDELFRYQLDRLLPEVGGV